MATTKVRRVGRLATIAVAGALVAGTTACSSSSAGPAAAGGASGGGECSTPGFSSTAIKIGGLTSQSGVYSATFAPFIAGAQARLAVENAAGGVNGRKLNLTPADDGSDPARNQAASQQLVQANGVFAILEASAFTAGGGPYLARNNVPVIGSAVSPEYQSDQNFIGFSNVTQGAAAKGQTSRMWGEYLKSQGGTIVDAIGSGTPAGNLAAQAIMASSAAVGLQKGVLTTDLPIGATNFTGEAQKAKNAEIDALALVTQPTPSAAALQAMKQAGVKIKASVLLAGYDPSQIPAQLTGLSFYVPFAPMDLDLPVQQQFIKAMKQYTKTNPLSGYFPEQGWISADLLITALKEAGSCPSRQDLIDTIHKIKGYTAGGFLPATDFDVADHGGPTTCAYFATIDAGKWVTQNGGKPFCASDTTAIKY